MQISYLFLVFATLVDQPEAGSAPSEQSVVNDPVPEAQRSESDSAIVVEGPPTVLERRRELRNMVAKVVNEPRPGRTVATYFDAICPQVRGLPEKESRVIEARIRENAETLGANRRNPSRGCTPNVKVIFVPSSKGPADQWVTADNDMLDHLRSYQRTEVLNDPDPARAWTYVADRTADGGEFPKALRQRIDGPLDWSNSLRMVSRLTVASTVEITQAVVMIEMAAAQDKTLGQLADYASMRTFGNTRSIDPETTPAAPTILKLFQDDNPPEELTTFDRALVAKLYSTSRNSPQWRYLSNIADRALTMEQTQQSAGTE
ncbi:hypothetical protein [Erythrobacter ani]|uniref:Uncharacterized protein n=1 Tax=Erythrobacter ani TaxID=2827235 RepID=A0ABS6SQH6_9SPHN|nr:hypothetical protein [Erythrobacter ani]MBV7266648.1 hypothetical protein [Erythrobacter ani]